MVSRTVQSAWAISTRRPTRLSHAASAVRSRVVDWAREFYSTTGAWWGPAEATITGKDHARARVAEAVCGRAPKQVLELGCGYGATVAAFASVGHSVTGVEISDRADFAHRFTDQFGESCE